MAQYGAGGKYPEENDPAGGGETRSEKYPVGKSGGVTGTPSKAFPGSTGSSNAPGKRHARSAANRADSMGPAGRRSPLG